MPYTESTRSRHSVKRQESQPAKPEAADVIQENGGAPKAAGKGRGTVFDILTEMRRDQRRAEG